MCLAAEPQCMGPILVPTLKAKLQWERADGPVGPRAAFSLITV